MEIHLRDIHCTLGNYSKTTLVTLKLIQSKENKKCTTICLEKYHQGYVCDRTRGGEVLWAFVFIIQVGYLKGQSIKLGDSVAGGSGTGFSSPFTEKPVKLLYTNKVTPNTLTARRPSLLRPRFVLQRSLLTLRRPSGTKSPTNLIVTCTRPAELSTSFPPPLNKRRPPRHSTLPSKLLETMLV